MTRYGLVCLLLGALAWGQAANPTNAPAAQKPGTAPTAAPAGKPGSPEPDLSKISPDTPVITISGMCDLQPAEKSQKTDCKTVITRADFERIVEAVQPNMPPRARRQFANRYANALAMTAKAHELGLDQGPKYDEHMKLARVQVLSQMLNVALNEKASQVSDKDIEDYYHANMANFDEADLKRIYIPRTKQPEDADEKVSEADQQKNAEASEAAMKAVADKIHTRAAAGEDFEKLQADAFKAAEIKSQAPPTAMGKVRRTALAASQGAVMELKTGEVSAVLSDQGGFYVFKMGEKDTVPLDKVKDEIRATLRGKRLQDEMHAVQEATSTTLDEAYFGPEPPMHGMQLPQPGAPQAPKAPPAGPK
jgi:hypothetical protein